MLASLALAAAASTSPVTALSLSGGVAFVGRADGAIDRVGRDLSVLSTLRGPLGGPVSFVSASASGVAWLQGPGGAIRERVTPPKPAPQLLTIGVDGRTVSVRLDPPTPVRRLGWLQGRVAVGFDFGTTFFDVYGHVVPPSTFMPADVAALIPSSSLFLREQADGTEFALFARPYSVRQDERNQKAPLVSLLSGYQVGAWQWAALGGFASNAFDAFPDGALSATEDGRLMDGGKFLVLSDRIGLFEGGFVAREPDALATIPLFARDWSASRQPTPPIPGDALWFGAGGDWIWWWTGTALGVANRRDGSSAAYLPWAGDVVPTCFAADAQGLWIGSNLGLRYLDPARSDFGGFVRAPLGLPAPSDPISKRLTEAIFAWRFADAEKAGSDGGQMIASVFRALGLHLPATAGELKSAGAPVTGDLRFGDVIVGPRAAAIYLGDGMTVEVRDGRVQNGNLWAFPHATVRRFAPSE